MDGSSINWSVFSQPGTNSAAPQDASDSANYYQSQIQRYDEEYNKAAERFRKKRPVQSQTQQQNQQQGQQSPQQPQSNAPSKPSDQKAAKPETTPPQSSDSSTTQQNGTPQQTEQPQSNQPQQQNTAPQQTQQPPTPTQPELQTPPTPTYPEGFNIENLMPGGQLPNNVNPKSLLDALRVYARNNPDKATQAARALLFNLMQQHNQLAQIIDPTIQPDEATIAYLQRLQRAGTIDNIGSLSHASDFINALSHALGADPAELYQEHFYETRMPDDQGSTLFSRIFIPNRVPTFAKWHTLPEQIDQNSPQFFQTTTNPELDKIFSDIANTARKIQEGQYWAAMTQNGMESPAVDLARRWMALAQRSRIRPPLQQAEPIPMPLPNTQLQPIEPIPVPQLPYQQ